MKHSSLSSGLNLASLAVGFFAIQITAEAKCTVPRQPQAPQNLRCPIDFGLEKKVIHLDCSTDSLNQGQLFQMDVEGEARVPVNNTYYVEQPSTGKNAIVFETDTGDLRVDPKRLTALYKHNGVLYSGNCQRVLPQARRIQRTPVVAPIQAKKQQIPDPFFDDSQWF